MSVVACSRFTEKRRSREAGAEAGSSLLKELGVPPRVVAAYMTVNHDQRAFLAGLRDALGEDVPVVGCSGQGVIGRGVVREEGYAASVLALGGEGIQIARRHVEDIHVETFAKGKELARMLRADLPSPPKFVVLNYDPLGVDMERFLEGLSTELDCPVLGGGAAHYYGVPVTKTFQYLDDQLLNNAAVAFAGCGDFTVEHAMCNGCSPVGIELTVTRAEGNYILELDGRPALHVWMEMAGSGGQFPNDISALAIGVQTEGDGTGRGELIRAAFMPAEDGAQDGLMLQASVSVGTKVMLHHRTAANVLEGADAIGKSLARRLTGRKVIAGLGFECGARTMPFLGCEGTRQENLQLQRTIGPEAAWVGAVVWGEIAPVAGRATLQNYMYPVLVIAE